MFRFRGVNDGVGCSPEPPDGRCCFARASGGHGCHACECLSVIPRIDRIRILPVAVACTESTADEVVAAAPLTGEVFVLAADAGIQDRNNDARQEWLRRQHVHYEGSGAYIDSGRDAALTESRFSANGDSD